MGPGLKPLLQPRHDAFHQLFPRARRAGRAVRAIQPRPQAARSRRVAPPAPNLPRRAADRPRCPGLGTPSGRAPRRPLSRIPGSSSPRPLPLEIMSANVCGVSHSHAGGRCRGAPPRPRAASRLLRRCTPRAPRRAAARSCAPGMHALRLGVKFTRQAQQCTAGSAGGAGPLFPLGHADFTPQKGLEELD